MPSQSVCDSEVHEEFSLPGVTQWYEDRTVLVTGGAGFVGKVLLEKVLRVLPVRRVFLLLRPKGTKTVSRRLDEILALPVFDRVREELPRMLKTVQVLEGDLRSEGLGLAEADRLRLQEEVSVVFHCAASVRLEGSLADALRNNTLSTRHMLDLAKQMPHLKAFVHLSTTFCHPEEDEVQERVYACPTPPSDFLHLLNCLDDKALDSLAPHVLGAHPNTYTFTKRLSEKLVDQERCHLPVLIVRPSIVTPAVSEPLPGWVDSMSGPVGIAVGAGHGVIRSAICDSRTSAEFVPVDLAANAVIIATWDASTHRVDDKETPVYNATSGDTLRLTWKEILQRWYPNTLENPFEHMLWYPRLTIRSNELAHAFIVLIFQFLPAYTIDLLLLLAMRKPFMVQLQRRIAAGQRALKYFSMRKWSFCNARLLEVESQLSSAERRLFLVSPHYTDISTYLRDMQLGARTFCRHQSPESLPRARRTLATLYMVDVLTKCICGALLLYILAFSFKYLKNALDVISSTLVTWIFERVLCT